jgi:hypothetical protein
MLWDQGTATYRPAHLYPFMLAIANDRGSADAGTTVTVVDTRRSTQPIWAAADACMIEPVGRVVRRPNGLWNRPEDDWTAMRWSPHDGADTR